MLINISPKMKVFVSVRLFSKNGIVTKITVYCSWTCRPEAMNIQVVRQRNLRQSFSE